MIDVNPLAHKTYLKDIDRQIDQYRRMAPSRPAVRDSAELRPRGRVKTALLTTLTVAGALSTIFMAVALIAGT